MRRPTALCLLILSCCAPAATAQKAVLPKVTPEVYRDATAAAQHLMDRMDVNLDGYLDMRDAETIVASRIGPAGALAVQGAMRMDLDGDGKITQEEVRAFSRRYFDLLAGADGRIPGRDQTFEQYLEEQMQEFRNWDLDHDGVVTRKEVETFVGSEDPHRTEAVRNEYARYIATMDTDGDGRVSLVEMTKAFLKAATYPSITPAAIVPSHGVGLRAADFAAMQATAILKEFDAGPDGTVSYAQAVRKGGENCYLLSMDTERDGVITRAKIERRAAAAARLADVDGDGYLSQSEMIEAWKMLHGMKPWRIPAEAAPPGMPKP